MDRARQAQGLYEALALFPAGTDFAHEMQRLSTGAAVAAYDARTNQLFVRRTDPTPFVRAMIVHELARAIDDQNFEIDRPQLAVGFDDPSSAFDALVEGSATAVQTRYIASLPQADRDQVTAEQRRRSGLLPRDVPPSVLATLAFSSGAGQQFVVGLLAHGGSAQLDAAFKAPPATTEQILHPDRYLAHEASKATARPDADGSVARRGEFGQLLLTLMLAGHMDPTLAAQAAEGWGGDDYVTWQQGSKSCARVVLSMDTTDDDSALGNALATWATKTGGTTNGSGPFTATRCSG
jgi:hypothetical protein